MTRAAIYARISQADPDVDAIASQLAACRALATSVGYDVTAEYSDDGISGWKGKHRPGFLELSDAIRAGQVNVILAVAEDRFTRNAEEKLGFQSACAKQNVTWHTVAGGMVDPATAQGRLLGTITGGIAEYESTIKSERVARSVRDRLADGKDLGGPRPFGYDRTAEKGVLVINEGEAELIRAAYRAVLDGTSIYKIAASWDRSEYAATGKSARWRTQTVRSIILRPRNAGFLVVGGTEYPSASPAVVDRETFDKVRAILEDPARAPKRGPVAVKYTATGLLYCDRCGSYFRIGGSEGKRLFRCAREGRKVEGRHPTITASTAETQLGIIALAGIAKLVEDGERVDSGDSTSAVRADLAELRRKRMRAQDELLDADEGADLDHYRKRISELGVLITKRTTELDALLSVDQRAAALNLAQTWATTSGNVDVDETAADAWERFWFDTLTMDQRRTLLRGMYSEIRVYREADSSWQLRVTPA